MTKRLLIIFAVSLFFVVTDAFAETTPKAKNVILFIGDGMGFNSDLAGTYYRYGEAKKQSYHAFPVHVGCTTYSLGEEEEKEGEHEEEVEILDYNPEVFWQPFPNDDQYRVEYTDSAAASTAIHGGTKTLDGKVGMDAHNKPVELISEIAVKTGRKAGCVTSDLISRATPAAFAAHFADRGDLDTIFNQMIGRRSPLSVVMGGGQTYYAGDLAWYGESNKPKIDRQKWFFGVGYEAIWAKRKDGTVNGFAVINTKKQFEKLASVKSGAGLPSKVIGIVHCGITVPPVDGSLDDIEETQKMFKSEYPRVNIDEVPDLATMSLGAINVLTRNNNKGFVLMIEGGAIDHANHGHNIKKSVIEHTGFSKAIDAIVQWVETKSSWDETLVIVTADHETGGLWGADTFQDSNDNGVFDKDDVFNDFTQIENTGRGNIPKVQYARWIHTNGLVPLYAKGPGSELFLKRIKGNDPKAADYWKFSGDYVDNTDIFHVMKAVIVP